MSSIAISTSTLEESRAVNWGRFALVGLATVVATTVANVLVYFIGDTLVAYHPRFDILATVAFPLDLAEQTASVMSNARVTTIPAAGHWPALENPSGVVAVVRDFLAEG
jgi:pimeloyl-ACP methyl ester carboxylesterase